MTKSILSENLFVTGRFEVEDQQTNRGWTMTPAGNKVLNKNKTLQSP
jgi:hypothetical protein